MTRSRYNKDGQGSRHYSGSSESSLSSESEVESTCDSDALSDGLELGKDEADRFKRLRRIFLNRPIKPKRKYTNQQRQRSPSDRRSQLERGPSITERPRSSQRRSPSILSNGSSTSDARTLDRPSKPTDSARPLQAAIDQHIHSLREQMKRHSVQRDATANQVHNMLEQAVDELQFLKKQEERALENQVRLIRESYALQLEVFQQQYLSKVTEIEDEMYASIQKRQEECDATILAAAKKLQDQTQHALLKDLAMKNSDPIEEQLDSSSTASSSASQSRVHRHRSVRPLRHDPLSSTQNLSRAEPTVKQISPVSKQRAKLQALEEKLAAFSPESLTRVKNELAAPIRRNKTERTAAKPKREAAPKQRHLVRKTESKRGPFDRDADEWQASPLSPLRKGPSYWKHGISLEARAGGGHVDSSKNGDDIEERARQVPASFLSRRFLRPEEEDELRHLRTSIGLAKDWMAKISHV